MRNTFMALLMILTGCIGQDVIDDAIMAAQLSISPENGVLRVGETLTFSYKYFNQFGQPDDATLSWTSTDQSIIDINENGVATAVTMGQVMITATTSDAQSNQALVTVVEDDSAVASVVIINGPSTIPIGGSAILTARALNILGGEISGVTFSWSSNNTNVATVNEAGEVQGVASGNVFITAEANGINSSPLEIIIGSTGRDGTFESPSGYTAKGTANLSVNTSNELTLILSQDFETSFALGTFIYLANSTEGSAVRSGGLEIAELQQNGAHEFNISAISSNTNLNTYRYVVILCKPASITFGFADLE